MRKQKKTRKQACHKELLSTKAGTATSSPANKTPSQTDKDYAIPNVLWFMKKNGYAETTIRATGKRLRLLQKNCNLQDPENANNHLFFVL